MPKTTTCVICEEVPVGNEDEICAACHEEAAQETDEELRAAGIDMTDSPVVVAAEVARRIFG